MTSLLYALTPVFIILFYVYFRDKYEKEPLRLLLISLAAGILIVLPIMYFESLLSRIRPPLGRIGNAGYDAFLVAALVEESFKFLALYLIFWKNKQMNEKFDGIVYAVFISLGFAAVENIMYVNRFGDDIALTRAITAVPVHALLGVRMGYFFGIAHMYSELRKKYLTLAFIVPFVLHGIYDFMLMAGLSWLMLLFAPYVVYLYLAGFRKMKITSESSIFRTDVKLPD